MTYLQQLLTSPIVLSFFFFAVLIPFFIQIRSKDTEGYSAAFIVLCIVLFIKDCIGVFFPDKLIWFIAVTAFFTVTACAFTLPYRRLRIWLFLLVFINIVSSLLVVLQSFISALAFFSQSAMPVLWLLDLAAILVLWLANKKHSETLIHDVLNIVIPFALVTMVLYAGFGILLGHTSQVFTHVIAPASSWWLVFTALLFYKKQDKEMVVATNYYEETFDSLYNLFIRTSTILKDSFEAEDILRSLNEAIHEEIHADGSMIFLVDEFDEQLAAKAYTGNYPPPFALPEGLPKKENRIVSYMKHVQFDFASNILGECAKTRINIYIPDAFNDGRIVQNGDESFLQISSLIAVPLTVEEKVMGVFTAVKTQPEAFFTEKDFDRTKMLANFGTIALSNFLKFLEVKERSNIQQSADTAAQIQKAMIPKKLPQYKTMQLGAFLQPSTGVSGDYYDVIQTRKDRVVVVVGDIAGKGIIAAILLVMIRALLHLICNTPRDMATVLDWVNKGITGKIDFDHFATLALLSINLENGEMEYANAGHQPMLIYRRATNSIETVEIQSLPIGVEKNSEYSRKMIKLNNGDIVALYTDGLIECMNEQGKQFGRKALSNIIIANKDLASKEIVNKIKSEVSSFSGSVRQHDDKTILLFKINL
mgnify:CR=1 FL=1